MQGLEKIFKEIEQKKENCLNAVKIEIDPMEITIHRERYKGLCMAEEIIRKYMNDGWIPVEERLPIPNKEVWVTVKRNGTVFTSTDAMTKNGCFWNYEKENIFAWKEKDITPDPYQPKQQNKPEDHYLEWRAKFLNKFDRRE